MNNRIKTKLGYIKSTPRPTQEYLNDFYQNLYFKEGITVTYNNKYSKREIYLKKVKSKLLIDFISQNLSNKKKRKLKFLEIGSGEGYLINAALKTNWLLKGVDYQVDPIKKLNKKALPYFVEKDPSVFIKDAIKNKEKYNIIVIQNVLEHVLDPEILISDLKTILNNTGILLIQIPNDYSITQKFALREKRIKKEYWFLPPQHLNYFNTKNLRVFLKKFKMKIIDAMSDFPIEFYLWGNKKNYTSDKSLGPYAHQARLAIEFLISKNSSHDILNFYRSLYNVNLGRNQILIVKKIKK